MKHTIKMFQQILTKLHPKEEPVEPVYTISLGEPNSSVVGKVSWDITVQKDGKAEGTYALVSSTVNALDATDNTTVVGNKVTVDYTAAGGTTDEEVKIVVKCVEDNTKTATGTYTIA